jgi:propionyl-CoA carboxylase alpha chain
MFKKILIANRGEIAVRVMRTARRLGIKTVAVYSDADADALHVETADEAVCIGPAPSAESYLVADTIIRAAKETGAQAIHPGYGFLSENAAFARKLKRQGIAFIGPGPAAIASMGDKITSKALAEKAGVNTIPGHGEALRDGRQAVSVAKRIGYPVMLKAAAGGGGKGMRIARNDAEARDGFASATREAKSSFGDGRVFAEKFVENPRHIEIQVLADGHGNTIYLGERECSLQRRHQKVIEEAPSPFIDEDTRRAMGEQAVALAQSVKYVSAGTVEFIVDSQQNFFFLEMNTRLQVEHPVTEMVTGLDLVEEMIRIAAGERLSLAQEDVRLDGWAIEARVYAEDPVRNFLPSVGRLVRYLPPDGVRVDTGVYEGGEISIYYDPMIAKVIAGGDDRDQAIGRLQDALDAFYIDGVSNNIGFLAALMAHPRFQAGDLTTAFIDEEYPDGFHAADLPHADPPALVAVSACLHRISEEIAATIGGQLPGRGRTIGAEWTVVLDGQHHAVSMSDGADATDVTVDGITYAVDLDWRPGNPIARARINGAPIIIQVARQGVGYRLLHSGSEVDVLVLEPLSARLQSLMPVKAPPDLSKYLLSPMPGLLVSVAVKAGQEVKAGDELAIIEAMKMENVLRAEHNAVISAVRAEPGDSLAVDQIILEFE